MGPRNTAPLLADHHHPQAHVLMFALPAMGHINPMLQLAKHLAVSDGVRVTFVYMQHDIRRLKPAPAMANGSTSFPDPHITNLVFEVVSDRIPPELDLRAYFWGHRQLVEGEWQSSLDSLVSRLATPPVTCIVADYFLPWTRDVAAKHGLPWVVFWPQSATVLAIYASMPLLEEKGLTDDDALRTYGLCSLHASAFFLFYMFVMGLSVKFAVRRGCERASAELLNSSIPGLPTLRGVDLPHYWVTPNTENPRILWMAEVIRANNEHLSHAAFVLCNTFHALESGVIDHLQRTLPVPFLPVGPLLPEAAAGPSEPQTPHNGARLSYWPEDEACISWLDGRAPNSVVYVSVGSVVDASPEHVRAIAAGLQASEQPFLWVVRGFAEDGSASLADMLPEGYLRETEEQGLIVSWAPQLRVLSHPAVGGFFTHGGWNSTLEAISMGVPMVVWPWLLDQKTNSRMVEERLGVGLELATPSSLDFMEEAAVPLEPGQLAQRVRTLMHPDQAHAMRGRVAKLREEARTAALNATYTCLRHLAPSAARIT